MGERIVTFVFWGLFVVLGLIAFGYYAWMLWAEREEPGGSARGAAPDDTGAP